MLVAGDRGYPASFYTHSYGDELKGAGSSAFLESHPSFRMETRRAIVWFENKWQLSTVWGDATYSSNRMGSLRDQVEFIEEPQCVEVGVLAPVAFVRPAMEFDLPSGKIEMPEYEHNLWGDPLPYVTVEEYHRVAELVMNLATDMEFPDEVSWDSAEGFCDYIVTMGMKL